MSSRREFLTHIGGGFGALALAALDQPSVASEKVTTQSDHRGAILPRWVTHQPRVRRVIQLFMNGGASQMDLFDYKPALAKRHGEKIDFGVKAAATSVPGTIMKSPFEFRQHGESGRWVSSVIPHLATCVDELAFLMAMASKSNVHGPASYMQNTGFILPGFPSFGSWVSYALGRITDDLPTFVVLPDPRGLPYNNMGNFSNAFLPATHAATVIKPTAPVPIADLFPPEHAKFITPESATDGLQLLQTLNRDHARQRSGDTRLDARIESYELAARLQLSAPEVLDVSRETAATQKMYGLHEPASADFGRQCLVARRMIERGVRFVQVWSGAGGASKNWDNHSDIPQELPFIARQIDQPTAGLLKDLKSRGLLEDTLVIWTTEFGRMPFTQGSVGRDHNGGTFVSWLAGAGIKAGSSYGESDEYSYQAAINPTYCYDLHATVLHLLGIDHERLTVRHNGLDRRLTDVHGHVIHEILSGS
jgi:hypothetical protein